MHTLALKVTSTICIAAIAVENILFYTFNHARTVTDCHQECNCHEGGAAHYTQRSHRASAGKVKDHHNWASVRVAMLGEAFLQGQSELVAVHLQTHSILLVQMLMCKGTACQCW